MRERLLRSRAAIEFYERTGLRAWAFKNRRLQVIAWAVHVGARPPRFYRVKPRLAFLHLNVAKDRPVMSAPPFLFLWQDAGGQRALKRGPRDMPEPDLQHWALLYNDCLAETDPLKLQISCCGA